MSHISGHVPNGTLYIRDTLNKNEHHVHAYLYLSKPANPKGEFYPDEDFKILFLNNRLLNLPEPKVVGKGYPPLSQLKYSEIEKRMVGFHLLLIEMPENKAKPTEPTKWGIAYDLVPWKDHQCTEQCVQNIQRYNGKRIEDIDPDELFELANRLGNKKKDAETNTIIRDLIKNNTAPDQAISILKQSASYLKSTSFKTTRAGNSPYDWIRNNIVKFDKLPELFGEYYPDKKVLQSLTIQSI